MNSKATLSVGLACVHHFVSVGARATGNHDIVANAAEFPTGYKGESLAQCDALNVFKGSDSALSWTFISPAAELFPGEKQQTYRIGVDTLLVDANGNNRISVRDYEKAVVDEKIRRAKGLAFI